MFSVLTHQKKGSEVRNSTFTQQPGRRQEELSPGDETRALIGSSLPFPFGELLLFPPEELHVDLVFETLEVPFGNSLRDIRGVYTPATSALSAVLAQEFEGCHILLNLVRRFDDVSDEADSLRRTFLVKFSGLSDNSGDLVIYGTQSSDHGFGRSDWWRLFRHSTEGQLSALPTFFTVRLMEKNGRVRVGHSQMRGLLNCCKQILNSTLEKNEKKRKDVLRRMSSDERCSLDDVAALRALMEEPVARMI